MSPEFFDGWGHEGAYSQAVEVHGRLYCSGIRAVNRASGTLVQGGLEARVDRCLKNLNALLESAGSSIRDVAQLGVALRNARNVDVLDEVLARWFESGALPAVTVFEVNRLEDDHDVEIDCVAAPGGRRQGPSEHTPGLSAGRLVRVGDDIWISGTRSEEAGGRDFRSRVKEVFDRIASSMATVGAGLDDLYSTRVHLRNMLDRAVVNEVSKEYYGRYPLRVIIEVPRLPGDRDIQIEGEASLNPGREYLSTTKGQVPTGPFSQGVKIGNFLYCSGVRPIDPGTSVLVGGGFRDRVVQCMHNLSAILEQGGGSLHDVFATRVYLRNLAGLGVVDEVFREVFPAGRLPVRTAVEISRLNEDYEKGWVPNHDVEIQCSAITK